jgi:hypothetical protein
MRAYAGMGSGRIRCIVEVCMVCGEAGFSVFLRVRRLQWAGHLVRMNDCRIPKKSNRRKKVCGKPRDRWEDVVWKDAIDLLWIRNWKAATRKKEDWRKKIGKVMA